MSDVTTIGSVLAVVVLREAKDKVAGGMPIFIVETKEEQEKVALIMSRILKAMAHDLENGVYFLTRH